MRTVRPSGSPGRGPVEVQASPFGVELRPLHVQRRLQPNAIWNSSTSRIPAPSSQPPETPASGSSGRQWPTRIRRPAGPSTSSRRTPPYPSRTASSPRKCVQARARPRSHSSLYSVPSAQALAISVDCSRWRGRAPTGLRRRTDPIRTSAPVVRRANPPGCRSGSPRNVRDLQRGGQDHVSKPDTVLIVN
jgi:hypothetical protein